MSMETENNLFQTSINYQRKTYTESTTIDYHSSPKKVQVKNRPYDYDAHLSKQPNPRKETLDDGYQDSQESIQTEFSNFLHNKKISLSSIGENTKSSKLPNIVKSITSKEILTTSTTKLFEEIENHKKGKGESPFNDYNAGNNLPDTLNNNINAQIEEVETINREKDKQEYAEQSHLGQSSFRNVDLKYSTNYRPTTTKTIDPIGRPEICTNLHLHSENNAPFELSQCQIFCCSPSSQVLDMINEDSDIVKDLKPVEDSHGVKNDSIHSDPSNLESNLKPLVITDTAPSQMPDVNEPHLNDEAIADSREINNVLPENKILEKQSRNKIGTGVHAVKHGNVQNATASDGKETVPPEKENGKDTLDLEAIKNMVPKYNQTHWSESGAKKFAASNASKNHTQNEQIKRGKGKENEDDDDSPKSDGEKRIKRETIITTQEKIEGKGDLQDGDIIEDLCELVTLHLRGSNFNVTLKPDKICFDDVAMNLTYHIPMSKYMPDKTLHLSFTSSQSREFVNCKTANTVYSKNEDCPINSDGAQTSSDDMTLNDKKSNQAYLYGGSGSSFQIDVSGVTSKVVVFRASITNSNQNVCDIAHNKLREFIEYNLHLYRHCDESN